MVVVEEEEDMAEVVEVEVEVVKGILEEEKVKRILVFYH